MSNCTCGRTTRKPMCDKSCSLSEAEYIERTARLSQLWKTFKVQNSPDPLDTGTTSVDNSKT